MATTPPRPCCFPPGRRSVRCSGDLEHALLSVRPGRHEAFEQAFAEATQIISAMPGFGGLTLSRCLERSGGYLLLGEWATLEDHTVGFRGSPEYEQWRALLHSFYDPFPTGEHYTTVLAADPAPEENP